MTVRSVRVLSVGEVSLRPNNVVGTGAPMLWWTFTSRRWTQPLPVNVALIEHDRGWVLWDTGQAPGAADTPREYFPGGLVGAVYARQVKSALDPGQRLDAQLQAAGVAASDLALVAVSHLHYDHAGNVDLFAGTGVPVLVSAQEWELASSRSPENHGILTRHLALTEVGWTSVTFSPTDDPALAAFASAHDVFSDGSLVLLPTPGHSPGSMSLLVRREGAPPLLFVGDVTYDATLLEQGTIPDVGDRAIQRDTYRRIAELSNALPGLRIIAGHDPRAADLLAG